MRLGDSTDATGEFWVPFSIMSPVGNDQNVGNPVQFRFRMEMVSGAVPEQRGVDTDQKSLHFIGPV